jgi:hypothetical protein
MKYEDALAKVLLEQLQRLYPVKLQIDIQERRWSWLLWWHTRPNV